jgi:hypothetical protein
MKYIIDRLKEPSTYAGIAAMLAAFGLHVEDSMIQVFVSLATGLAGVVSILLSEKPA